MNEKYGDTCTKNSVPCREIVTKERLYERLNNAIRQSQVRMVKEEAKLEVLEATKRNLDEYFEDLGRK